MVSVRLIGRFGLEPSFNEPGSIGFSIQELEKGNEQSQNDDYSKGHQEEVCCGMKQRGDEEPGTQHDSSGKEAQGKDIENQDDEKHDQALLPLDLLDRIEIPGSFFRHPLHYSRIPLKNQMWENWSKLPLPLGPEVIH